MLDIKDTQLLISLLKKEIDKVNAQLGYLHWAKEYRLNDYELNNIPGDILLKVNAIKKTTNNWKEYQKPIVEEISNYEFMISDYNRLIKLLNGEENVSLERNDKSYT